MKDVHALDIRDTVARAFPGNDRVKAERLLRWLDSNGYAIVRKAESDAGSSIDRAMDFHPAEWISRTPLIRSTTDDRTP